MTERLLEDSRKGVKRRDETGGKGSLSDPQFPRHMFKFEPNINQHTDFYYFYSVELREKTTGLSQPYPLLSTCYLLLFQELFSMFPSCLCTVITMFCQNFGVSLDPLRIFRSSGKVSYLDEY